MSDDWHGGAGDGRQLGANTTGGKSDPRMRAAQSSAAQPRGDIPPDPPNPRGKPTEPSAAQGQYRELTPEQYHQGFIVPGGWRVPFGRILRVTENGTYIVKEPKPDAR